MKYASFLLLFILFSGCRKIHKEEVVYKIPDTYSGWVKIRYKLEKANTPVPPNSYTVEVNSNGTAELPYSFEPGAMRVEYVRFPSNKILVPTLPGKGGEIWGDRMRYSSDQSGSDSKMEWLFFVGTEEQYMHSSPP